MKTPLRSSLTRIVLALVLSAGSWAKAQDPKFDAIKSKRDRGETLSPAEREYAQGVLAQRKQKQGQPPNQEFASKNPPRASTGLVALPDLGTDRHQGEQGGLYPAGRNVPPAAHAENGMKLARAIVPLDAAGKPSPEGRIVLLTVGMSNTTQESQAFIGLAADDAAVNPRLTIVDGAQGGQTAAITSKSDANYWTVNETRLRAAGVNAAQVQVVWLKEANARPTQPFPVEARKLQADLVATLQNLREKFPNLKIAYLSSRTYGGYATTPLNPEPHAYETGFAVKWTIADQIAGRPELNHVAGKGPLRAPWILWGPYLWTDGTKGRADGFVWQREDCADVPAAGATG
jgi:hypothetical protein